MTLLLFRDEYRVPALDPALAARIAMAQELTTPLLLFLGLATRIAALPLLGMIAVIQTFVYPNAWVEHLVWSSILVFLIARGPGAISLDHFLARRLVPEKAKTRRRRDRFRPWPRPPAAVAPRGLRSVRRVRRSAGLG